jgi:DNA-binding transcriptional LysR family regulator
VSVTCQVNTQAQAMDMLINGDLHFTLAGFEHITCSTIEKIIFLTDRIQLIVPANHPWTLREKIQIDDLFSGQFILREQDSGTFQTVQEALVSHGKNIEELNTVMTLGNSEAIALAVKEGLGVGFVSESVIDTLNNQGIQVVEVGNLEISREIYFNRNSQYPYSRAQNAFWDFLNEINPNEIKLNNMLIHIGSNHG